MRLGQEGYNITSNDDMGFQTMELTQFVLISSNLAPQKYNSGHLGKLKLNVSDLCALALLHHQYPGNYLNLCAAKHYLHSNHCSKQRFYLSSLRTGVGGGWGCASKKDS